MFAYVKILSGLNKNKKQIVSTSELLHFNAAKHNKNIKYQIKSSNGNGNDTCIILLLGDTKNQIEKEVKDHAMQANGNASQRTSKRLKNLPEKFLCSASASSSDEKSIPKKTTSNARTVLQGQELDDYIGKKLEQFHSSVEDNSSENYSQSFLTNNDTKTNKLTNKSSSTLSIKNTNENGENQQNVKTNNVNKSFMKSLKGLKSASTTEDKENHTVKDSKDKGSIEYPSNKHSQDKVRENNDNSVKRKNQSPTLPPQSVKRLKASTSTTKHNEKLKTKDSKDKQSIEYPDKNSQDKVRENNDKSVNITTKHNEKPKIKSNKTFDAIVEYDAMLKMSKSEREVLQEKINKLTKEVESLKRDNVALKKVKDLYKKKYLDKNAEFESLQKLNQDFQLTMIEKMKERDEMFQRLAESQKTVPLGCDFPSIGAFRMTDNMKRYHIGRDIWVSENEYVGMLNDAKTPSQLAGHIVTLLFTMQELLTSTKSGYKSRRTGPGKIECGKLDEIKLNACEEYYKYWLENIYRPTSKKDAKNLIPDMSKFYYYCGKKIADLKKPPTTSKKATKKKNKEQDNDTDAEESINEQTNHEPNGNVINGDTQDNGIEADDNNKEDDVINVNKNDDVTNEDNSIQGDDDEENVNNEANNSIQGDDDEENVNNEDNNSIQGDDDEENVNNEDNNSIQGDDDGNNSDNTEYNGNQDNLLEDPLRIDTLSIDAEQSDAPNNNYYDWSPAHSSTKSGEDLE